MKSKIFFLPLFTLAFLNYNCKVQVSYGKTAAEILGTPDHLAISYGGYRHITRDSVPSIEDIKEDLAILAAMGVKLVRTYNTQQFEHASNLLKAIRHMKTDHPDFEMYVMLGAWIDCKGAWGPTPIHEAENEINNAAEIEAAINLANTYPDIVKIIAVGNEAMVKWATSYYVTPNIILKWVNHLQELKKNKKLPIDLWITSSDNFASWGGEDASYHTEDLEALVKAVDYISMHTYPFHDTHYNPRFWGVPVESEDLSKKEQIDAAMVEAAGYAKSQYEAVVDYVKSLGVEKPIHVGETGWATLTNSLYGDEGSKATDEYKEKRYYENMRAWTNESGIACFYFEAFDEPWKDEKNPLGSENHFGLIKVNGEAKYALWELVDSGAFDGLTRGGKPITKTYKGDENALLADVLIPPLMSKKKIVEIQTVNINRKLGEAVTEKKYVVTKNEIQPDLSNDATYPSKNQIVNAWEGTCTMTMTQDGIIEVETGTGEWWGAGIEILGNGKGENLSNFSEGILNFDIKGDTESSFEIGFQTGIFSEKTQTNNYVVFESNNSFTISENWKSYAVKISDLNNGADFKDVTSLIYVKGVKDFDGKSIFLRNVYYSRE